MAGHKELIKKLADDDSLRQQIIDTPTREGKQEVVRRAGLDVPDHHDVLQEVAGGMDNTSLAVGGSFLGAGAAGAVAVAAAAAAV